MPQIPYRANLSSAIFPMLLSKAGRTVIDPKYDQNFDKRVDAAGETDKQSAGIPQAIYMENVLPTPNGFQSIGFQNTSTVTLESGDFIRAMTKIKVASIQTSTEISEDIDITDNGDTIENWDTSNFFNFQLANPFDSSTYPSLGESDTGSFESEVGNTIYTEVAESTAEGSPAVNSYRLSHLIGNLEAAGPDPSAYSSKLLRTLGIADATLISFDFRVRFKSGVLFDRDLAAPEAYDFEKFMNVVIANTTGLAGLRITYNSITGNLAIASSNGTVAQKITPSPIFSTALTIAYDTWYRFEVTVTLNGDNTRTVEVIAKDVGGSTLTTLTGIVATSVSTGPICGFIHDSHTDLDSANFDTANDYAISPDKVYYDEIELDATIPDLDVQINSGIQDRYIAWITGDSDVIRVGSSLPSFENTIVTEVGVVTIPNNDSEISTALVRGQCFICSHDGTTTHIYEYTEPLGVPTLTNIDATIEAGLLEGYTLDMIVNIASSFNYLILATTARVFWSSTTTPTDFQASLVSGAGSDIPNNLKGDITFVKEHVAGYYLYTTGNVVFSQYTGNARYPWKFREISGSGGFTRSMQVTGDSNTASQFGINNSRCLQSLNPDSAELIAPEVTDYIERGNVYDTFNSSTNVFSKTYLANLGFTETENKVWFLLDRYIVVPYLVTFYDHDEAGEAITYTYAVVFDALLKRYGKFKIEFSNIFTDNDEKIICTVNYETGQITQLIVDIHADLGEGAMQGVLILGKFQLIRDRFIQLHHIEIESSASDLVVEDPGVMTVIVLPSLDGKNFGTPITPFLANEVDQIRVYNLHNTAKNFCIAIKGTFDVSSLELKFNPHGKSL